MLIKHFCLNQKQHSDLLFNIKQQDVNQTLLSQPRDNNGDLFSNVQRHDVNQMTIQVINHTLKPPVFFTVLNKQREQGHFCQTKR